MAISYRTRRTRLAFNSLICLDSDFYYDYRTIQAFAAAVRNCLGIIVIIVGQARPAIKLPCKDALTI